MLDKCILPPPPGCPPEIYALMAKCWRFSAAKRIGFAKLLRSMAKTIKATAKTDALSSEEPLPLVPFKVKKNQNTVRWLHPRTEYCARMPGPPSPLQCPCPSFIPPPPPPKNGLHQRGCLACCTTAVR